MKLGPMTFVRERFRWGSYGFVGGVLVGAFLGWFFHGLISTIFRFGFVALLLIPLVIVFLVWRRFDDRNRSPTTSVQSTVTEPIETRGEVVEVRRRRESQ